MKETLSKPTPVRLNKATKPRLLLVAKKFRLSPAAIIRLAVDQKLTDWLLSDTLRIESRPAAK
jgi:hypothetical protein